jgi:hypothetical protein
VPGWRAAPDAGDKQPVCHPGERWTQRRLPVEPVFSVNGLGDRAALEASDTEVVASSEKRSIGEP